MGKKSKIINILKTKLIDSDQDSTLKLSSEEAEILFERATDRTYDGDLSYFWTEVDMEGVVGLVLEKERRGKKIYYLSDRANYGIDFFENLRGRDVDNGEKDAPSTQKEDVDTISSSPTLETFNKKTFLVVPISDKETVKKNGGKWDSDNNLWYAEEGVEVKPLSNWLIEKQEAIILSEQPSGNYGTVEAIDAIEDFGLNIEGSLSFDGRIHRVASSGGKKGNKNGWYVGYQGAFPIVVFGDWSLGDAKDSKQTWIPSEINNEEGKLHRDKILLLAKAKMAQGNLNLDEDHLTNAEKISNEFFSSRYGYDAHAYLKTKNVKNHYLRLDKLGNLLMPLRDTDNKIWTMQRIGKSGFKMIGIQRTKEQKEKDKRFPTKKTGHFYLIGARDLKSVRGNRLLVAEGYATAASVFEATGIPTIVSVDSGNMKLVATNIRAVLPDIDMFYCADNDMHNKIWVKDAKYAKNAGIDAAIKAAEATNGYVIAPRINGDRLAQRFTDWNDLSLELGKDKIKETIFSAIQKKESLYIFQSKSGLTLDKAKKLRYFIQGIDKNIAFDAFKRQVRDRSKEIGKNVDKEDRVYVDGDDYFLIAYGVDRRTFELISAYEGKVLLQEKESLCKGDNMLILEDFKDREELLSFKDKSPAGDGVNSFIISLNKNKNVLAFFDLSNEDVKTIKSFALREKAEKFSLVEFYQVATDNKDIPSLSVKIGKEDDLASKLERVLLADNWARVFPSSAVSETAIPRSITDGDILTIGNEDFIFKDSILKKNTNKDFKMVNLLDERQKQKFLLTLLTLQKFRTEQSKTISAQPSVFVYVGYEIKEDLFCSSATIDKNDPSVIHGLQGVNTIFDIENRKEVAFMVKSDYSGRLHILTGKYNEEMEVGSLIKLHDSYTASLSNSAESPFFLDVAIPSSDYNKYNCTKNMSKEFLAEDNLLPSPLLISASSIDELNREEEGSLSFQSDVFANTVDTLETGDFLIYRDEKNENTFYAYSEKADELYLINEGKASYVDRSVSILDKKSLDLGKNLSTKSTEQNNDIPIGQTPS